MDPLNDLNQFCRKISEYRKLVQKRVESWLPSDELIENIQNLRTDLQQSYARLESVITQYAGIGYITDDIFGNRRNEFDAAFDTISIMNFGERQIAINKALKRVNKAIGKLQAERDKESKVIDWGKGTIDEDFRQTLEKAFKPFEGQSRRPLSEKDKAKVKSRRPKAFISHSGNTPALTELRDYLDELDIEKIIVIKKPNVDREINTKVEIYMDEADFVIILATGDSKDRNGNTIPAGNVVHETGLAQGKLKFKGKIIYLLEEGVKLPSNIQPKGYIRFNRSNIEHKFGDIVKEIKEMGFL